jgi:hypothetical protein
MVGQVLQHPASRPAALEQVEDQPDRRAHLLVGIQRHLARGAPYIAARQPDHELAARRLGTAPLQHARFKNVQLRLAHCALEPEQQAVIVGARVVDAVRIRNQRVEQGAHLEQLVPVAAGARETRHLDAQDQAHVAKADLGHKTLEPWTVQGRSSRPAKVVIDNDHLLLFPAKLAGAISQRVLQPCGLLVLLHLAHRRLPDVDDRLPVTVPGLDLVGRQQACAQLDRAHSSPPVPPSQDAGGSADRSAQPGDAAARAAPPAT